MPNIARAHDAMARFPASKRFTCSAALSAMLLRMPGGPGRRSVAKEYNKLEKWIGSNLVELFERSFKKWQCVKTLYPW